MKDLLVLCAEWRFKANVPIRCDCCPHQLGSLDDDGCTSQYCRPSPLKADFLGQIQVLEENIVSGQVRDCPLFVRRNFLPALIVAWSKIHVAVHDPHKLHEVTTISQPEDNICSLLRWMAAVKARKHKANLLGCLPDCLQYAVIDLPKCNDCSLMCWSILLREACQILSKS